MTIILCILILTFFSYHFLTKITSPHPILFIFQVTIIYHSRSPLHFFFLFQVSILPTPHTVFFIFNIYHYLVHLTTSLYPSHHPCLVHLTSHSLSFTLPLSRPPASSHSLSHYHFLVHLKPVVSRPPLTMPVHLRSFLNSWKAYSTCFKRYSGRKSVSMGGFLNLG